MGPNPIARLSLEGRLTGRAADFESANYLVLRGDVPAAWKKYIEV
jgi:hypothetical protein